MLEELGVTHVLLGHSERRQLLGETDEMIQKKLHKALEHNLVVILCVGETKAQRDAGQEQAVVKAQLEKAVEGLRFKQADKLLIAYEPVWAIGTGQSADLSQMLEMHQWIKSVIHDRFKDIAVAQVRVLYGGSVTPENAYTFLREPLVDGVLVGGASVKLNQFNEIVQAASEVLEAQS